MNREALNQAIAEQVREQMTDISTNLWRVLDGIARVIRFGAYLGAGPEAIGTPKQLEQFAVLNEKLAVDLYAWLKEVLYTFDRLYPAEAEQSAVDGKTWADVMIEGFHPEFMSQTVAGVLDKHAREEAKRGQAIMSILQMLDLR